MFRFYQQLKNIYHYIQAQFWRAWYRRPDRGLTLYGVTGTNGKTTTCHLLASVLQQLHGTARVGMLTTITFWIGETKLANATKMTTLPSRQFFAYLHQMRSAGITHAVLEVTSHALDQHRLAGVTLRGAIILNIAREHLDYHHTIANYAAAKEKIVSMLAASAPLIGKADDPLVNAILDRAQQKGVPVHRFTSRDASAIATPLPGAVNQENACAAALLARAIGIPDATIQAGINTVAAVPGRMQWLDLPTGARALIDYAVTPDALERLYQGLRNETSGKIFAILGAAGLRDRGKRPRMAQIVSQYADQLIITREDPWTEPEEQIFTDLEAGLTAVPPGKWQRITDRRAALQYCVQRARSGDIVVATGKGAETGMAIGKHIVPWNEREIIIHLAGAVAATEKKV